MAMWGSVAVRVHGGGRPTHAGTTKLCPPSPFRSEVELAQIAHELDAAEHELMASAGVDSAEYAA